MPETPKIYEAINNVMAEIGAIKKKKRSTQGFNYRGVDDVMNALNPAFIKHRLFTVPEVLEQKREERQTAKGGLLIYSICKIKYTFFAEDGSSVEVITIGEGMDSGDKATNKAMAIAFKYACFQLFCIPTEEMVDPDAEGYEAAPKKDGKGKQGKPPAKPEGSGNAPAKPAAGTEPAPKVTQAMIQVVEAAVEKYSSRGLKMEKLLKMYRIGNIADMTVDQYKDCMEKLKLYEREESGHE